jgi:type II secretory pathway component PulF
VNVSLIGALRRLDVVNARSEFYRSWESALRAKQNIPESLQVMEPPGHRLLEEARVYLVEGIAKGRPVGVVAKLRPDLFPPLDQLLIGTGEGFGTLHDSLRLLSDYYRREFARMTRIRGWAAIPIVLGVAAAFVIPFPLFLDDRVPAYSAAAIAIVAALYLLGGIPVSLLYSFADRLDRIRHPRFAWTLAMGLEGGLTFAGAARLAATVGDMPDVGRHLDRIQPKVLKTMSLTQMLENSGIWPAMLTQVKAADEASEYLSTLRVFAEHLESPP